MRTTTRAGTTRRTPSSCSGTTPSTAGTGTCHDRRVRLLGRQHGGYGPACQRPGPRPAPRARPSAPPPRPASGRSGLIPLARVERQRGQPAWSHRPAPEAGQRAGAQRGRLGHGLSAPASPRPGRRWPAGPSRARHAAVHPDQPPAARPAPPRTASIASRDLCTTPSSAASARSAPVLPGPRPTTSARPRFPVRRAQGRTARARTTARRPGRRRRRARRRP